MEYSSHIAGRSDLGDLIEAETKPIDIVASWESLCETYRALEFSDTISDMARMEEFKWIVREMNKHLTRARKQLLSCKDMEAAKEALLRMYTTEKSESVSSRMELTYHKLKQMWVSKMVAHLENMIEIERSEHGQE